MPWDETTRMSQRVRFIGDFESCLYTMQLCERYSISRKTGYKWAERFAKEGVEGLKDRSRAPKRVFGKFASQALRPPSPGHKCQG